MSGETTLVLLAVAALVLAGGVAYWVVRRGGLRRDAATFHHFRCPNCRRRLRYQSRQVGHTGQCSHCRGPVTFPPVSQSVD